MEQTIAAVRGFNRFFTQRVGALDERFLGSDLTLAEARLLFEIAQADRPVAADLQAALGMDAGYVSRLLRRFETRGWIVRARGKGDARRRPIDLTPQGRETFAAIDARQRGEVAAMLAPLGSIQQADLLAALGTIRNLLGTAPKPGFFLRTFRSGDMGLIAARQSRLYEESFGWGRGLEILEGEATTAFLRNFKPGREQCWVAEVGGVMAGSIVLTDEGQDVARLRLFYVEPFARGRGIGDALVRTCVAFAHEAGFAAITLWTHTVLDSARRIYAGHGFHRVDSELHHEFGAPVMGETWQLDMARRPQAAQQVGAV